MSRCDSFSEKGGNMVSGQGHPPNSKGEENLGVPYPVGCSCPHPAQNTHPHLSPSPQQPRTLISDSSMQMPENLAWDAPLSSLPKTLQTGHRWMGRSTPPLSPLLCAHKLPSSLSATSLLPSSPHFYPEPQLKALIPQPPIPIITHPDPLGDCLASC